MDKNNDQSFFFMNYNAEKLDSNCCLVFKTKPDLFIGLFFNRYSRYLEGPGDLMAWFLQSGVSSEG